MRASVEKVVIRLKSQEPFSVLEKREYAPDFAEEALQVRSYSRLDPGEYALEVLVQQPDEEDLRALHEESFSVEDGEVSVVRIQL